MHNTKDPIHDCIANNNIFAQHDVISYLQRKGLSSETIERLQICDNQNIRVVNKAQSHRNLFNNKNKIKTETFNKLPSVYPQKKHENIFKAYISDETLQSISMKTKKKSKPKQKHIRRTKTSNIKHRNQSSMNASNKSLSMSHSFSHSHLTMISNRNKKLLKKEQKLIKLQKYYSSKMPNKGQIQKRNSTIMHKKKKRNRNKLRRKRYRKRRKNTILKKRSPFITNFKIDENSKSTAFHKKREIRSCYQQKANKIKCNYIHSKINNHSINVNNERYDSTQHQMQNRFRLPEIKQNDASFFNDFYTKQNRNYNDTEFPAVNDIIRNAQLFVQLNSEEQNEQNQRLFTVQKQTQEHSQMYSHIVNWNVSYEDINESDAASDPENTDIYINETASSDTDCTSYFNANNENGSETEKIFDELKHNLMKEIPIDVNANLYELNLPIIPFEQNISNSKSAIENIEADTEDIAQGVISSSETAAIIPPAEKQLQVQLFKTREFVIDAVDTIVKYAPKLSISSVHHISQPSMHRKKDPSDTNTQSLETQEAEKIVSDENTESNTENSEDIDEFLSKFTDMIAQKISKLINMSSILKAAKLAKYDQMSSHVKCENLTLQKYIPTFYQPSELNIVSQNIEHLQLAIPMHLPNIPFPSVLKVFTNDLQSKSYIHLQSNSCQMQLYHPPAKQNKIVCNLPLQLMSIQPAMECIVFPYFTQSIKVEFASKLKSKIKINMNTKIIAVQKQKYLLIKEIFARTLKNRIKNEVEKILFSGMSSPISKDEHGNTILHMAAQNGNKRLTEIALYNGTDINSQNKEKQTALHYLLLYKYEKLATYLISEGAV